uniref:Ribosomal operon-associated A protein n=1 Tax=Euglena longa TaxID=3037 RepID=ROAA_EUGLO|nr:hypothetical protein AsloCp28 [Euglena longa]P58145.1 RecName: Full=Ribosomal operon-associated A protein; Short=RoaA [Euglena longa]CAC24599.1 hypothetical protein [Euglena longa]
MFSNYLLSFSYRLNWDFIKWNLVDNIISLFHHEIHILSKNLNFRSIKKKQHLLFKSFYTRFVSVRDSVDNNFFFKSNIISSKEKFFIVFFLCYKRNFFYNLFFYNIEIINLSFKFNFFLFYKFCFNNLVKFVMYPFLELKTENFVFNFNFYTNLYDIFLNFKKILLKNFMKLYYFTINFNNKFNYMNKKWLYKNLTFNINFLKYFLKLNNFIFNGSILFFIFNFMFNGLKSFIQRKCFMNNEFIYVSSLKNIYFFFKSYNEFNICINYLIYFLKYKGINFNFINDHVKNFLTNGLTFNFIKFFNFGYKFLFKLNEKDINYYKFNIKTLIKNFYIKNIFYTICLINNKIKNWLDKYFLFVNKKYLFLELDIFISKLLWIKIKKYHPKKSNIWIYSKYWKNFSGIWKFFIINNISGKMIFLKYHYDFNNYLLYLKSNYSGTFSYLYTFNLYNSNKKKNFLFEKFKYKFFPKFLDLYITQKGQCYICKKHIYSKKFKIIKLKFDNNKFSKNIYLLHFYCNFI